MVRTLHTRSWSALLGAVLLLAGLASCAPASGPLPPTAAPAAPPAAPLATAAPAPAGAPDRLSHTQTTIAYPYWPSIVAQTKGFFERRRLQVEVTITPRIPDSARALAAGSHQTASIIPDTVLLAVAQGAPVALVGIECDRAAYRLAVQPTITSFADLRGKTFAVGAINDVTAGMLIRTLRLNGLAPGEYDLVSVGSTPERYAALVSGQVAGVLLTHPMDFRAEREGFRMLANLAEILPPYAFAGLLVNREWAQGQREVAVRWLAALLDSVRWLYDPANRDEAMAILAEATRTSEADAQATYAAVVEQERAYPPELRATRPHVEALVDLMREVGTAPEPLPDLDRFLDGSYLAEALRLAGPAGR